MLAAIFIGLIYFATDMPALAAFGLVGFFVPDLIFNNKIRARQADIMRSFPTFVDLAALTIEAGLDYMSAIDRILKNSKAKTELENELQKMINEIQLGYSRRDALKRLAVRTGIQEIRSFVGLIVQSDELGTSLVELLRSYATDMRFRRLNRAEKLAAQASTKMLIPLFIFIFPTVFIMMLAPMMKSLMTGGLGF
jgi:tight adherence protein C